MIANTLEISKTFKTNEIEVRLKVADTPSNLKELNKAIEVIENKKVLELSLKQHRKKRSLDANAMMWIICQKIAEKIGNTKEYVYRQAIKQVGQFEVIPIKLEVSNRWMAVWESKGVGWYSEILGHSKLEGYVNTINYYGSSVYKSKEMSMLLEEIIVQAKELGIDTMTDREKEELISKWKGV